MEFKNALFFFQTLAKTVFLTFPSTFTRRSGQFEYLSYQLLLARIQTSQNDSTLRKASRGNNAETKLYLVRRLVDVDAVDALAKTTMTTV